MTDAGLPNFNPRLWSAADLPVWKPVLPGIIRRGHQEPAPDDVTAAFEAWRADCMKLMDQAVHRDWIEQWKVDAFFCRIGGFGTRRKTNTEPA